MVGIELVANKETKEEFPEALQVGANVTRSARARGVIIRHLGDVVVLISSSGRSLNVIRAAEHARGRGLTVVTLTGFAPDNPLRHMGDLSLWVDSRSYNVVESVHQIWLLMVCDLIVGRMEYPVA